MKRDNQTIPCCLKPSPPARGRGLKLDCHIKSLLIDGVAPRAGAWIETPLSAFRAAVRMSPPARGRGLKRGVVGCLPHDARRPPRGGVD